MEKFIFSFSRLLIFVRVKMLLNALINSYSVVKCLDYTKHALHKTATSHAVMSVSMITLCYALFINLNDAW